MKTYQVTKIQGAPDWSRIPVAQISCHLWSCQTQIVPQAQLAWDQWGLHVRLQTKEQDILRRYTGFADPVYTDSCLEFFFAPAEGERYFNFEVNPNGALFVGYGLKNPNRCRLYREDWDSLLQLKPFDTEDGWGIEMTVPVELIGYFVPDFRLYSGQVLRGNFYKCGDETVNPHFIAWSPVEAATPQFHLPEFFGKLILE